MSDSPQYPANWQIKDYEPQEHMMQLKQRDYLNVQNRLLWFIRDQRDFIVRGLATTSYCIKTDLVEQDREAGYAHFKTYVRDVVGNEATMYGSESAKDFADYAEKASTKSLGRALLALGYGTAFAPEMDEGDRVVDTPTDHRRAASSSSSAHAAPANRSQPPVTHAPVQQAEPAASEQQMVSIRKLCLALGKAAPEDSLTYAAARELISSLSNEYQRTRHSEDDGEDSGSHHAPAPKAAGGAAGATGTRKAGGATEQQLDTIGKLCRQTGEPVPEGPLTFEQAGGHIGRLSTLLQKQRSQPRAAAGEAGATSGKAPATAPKVWKLLGDAKLIVALGNHGITGAEAVEAWAAKADAIYSDQQGMDLKARCYALLETMEASSTAAQAHAQA